MVLTSLFIFSFLPLFNWTFGAPLHISASVFISCWMKDLRWYLRYSSVWLQGHASSLYCLGSYMGSSLWITGNFSSHVFFASPIMSPSIEISLSLLSSLSFLHLDYSISSRSPPPPLLSSSLPSVLSSPHIPMLPILSGDLVYFPFPDGSIYVFLRVQTVT